MKKGFVMKFGLYDGDLKVMDVIADTEKEANVIIKKAGIRNKSKIFELIKEE